MDTLEMKTLIDETLPEAGRQIDHYHLGGNAYKSLAMVVNETVRRLRDHDLVRVIDCFRLANTLYEKGNELIKNAVVHVFVHAIGSFRKKCNGVEWKVIRTCMPVCIRTLYYEQLFSTPSPFNSPQC